MEIHPVKGIGPTWQTDDQTVVVSPSLFSLLDQALGLTITDPNAN